MILRRHHQPVAGGAPCCWVSGGSGKTMCTAHERAVGDAVRRDAGAVWRPAVDQFGPLSGLSDIDTDRPDSATPSVDRDRMDD